ncbi:MAG: bifunctional phosphopantothenoylcysteine decarboxylase/phosphopantothenate synthase [Alteraurantiacibacter sp. bin_em_oilr2.035]|uniref:bifunctional phosphopantothenoylcysteine decarboxylase/phosphopantothenate synthase n=1 Tax=Aurantiacibacter atlanticus TaxID=1648404 RepID=UPI0009EE7F8F|nr:bifunctional phosphopantothenoylcysteine decarboxylase/phosphopantothenate synthase [Aurantiacibacter atlanticus]MDF1833878.1 bifunctional phosphopantothenoylcysteine decarboxylase/phosphopantothenate synthase [Alteraurantiacibacter sp. bin_em_oilr2.035]
MSRQDHLLDQTIESEREDSTTNPRILLIVGGGIAAYKSCELVRLIKKGGAGVTCVLTNGGAQFVTPMSLAALSGNEVHTSLWDLKNEAEIGHIQLSREADMVVVCPATADMMAKMAAGIADDLATTLLLATNQPVMAVPAMNVKMWQHEATVRNVQTLRDSGVKVMEPDMGDMACGEFGPGRLPEPEAVFLEIAEILGLDATAASTDIAAYLARRSAHDVFGEEDFDEDGGGLSGLLSSIIPRTAASKADDGDDEFEGMELPEGIVEGPDLPDPDLAGVEHLMARKGKASAAPPTDREAINHEVNARQATPQPFEGEDAAAPVNPIDAPSEVSVERDLDSFDPLDGQPAFDQDIEHRPLYGKHVLVTAGPTHEPIDPVRYLANRSSGKQGFAIAAAAAAAGAKVTLVAGPVNLRTPLGVERQDVESAEEMAKAVRTALPVDVAIMVAAVADWRPRDFKGDKIKKRGSAPPALILTENPDILASVAASPKRPELLIGFAAETNDVVENARKKRKSKGVDWIVANDVSGDVMGGNDNRIHLVREGKVEHWAEMTKQDVAMKLVTEIAERLTEDA